MTRLLFVLGILLGIVPVAWAEYRKTPGTRVDLSALNGEFVRAGMPSDGTSCRDESGTVICTKQTGDFTEAERALMDAALAAHDPDIRAKRQAQQARDLASGDAKLKALGLTEAEIAARKD